MTAYLEVKGLEAGYGEFQVLWGVNLEIPERRMRVGVIGPNGAGKTTLMRAVAGLIQPKKGEVILEGKRLNGVPAYERVKMGIAYVPAEKELFPKMTVKEILELGAYTARAKDQIEKNLDYVFSLFPRLRERLNQKAGTLSGGEQQMLAIGRALMSSPRLLLLDEPSTGLAPLLTEELFNSLRLLSDLNEDLTILLVEQKVTLVLKVCELVYVLEGGRVVMKGDARVLTQDPRVRANYLGGS
ncbi:MAG: ABC transporter ATP-binding protein [Thaumarchaeota archaeon]|nr:ABC transporter ATP-binding protein [Candidatus Calditenuaceae archaeon]MDW8186691.1 ABC transporter ATP-binding protein [Nitrososphaerota archaeon]